MTSLGGGDLSIIWKQIHNICDTPYVQYNGPKYCADKEDFWQRADIFVFPTFYYNECFPLVLLEAMQHGVACVSTIEGGIPDIIDNEKTGYVCQKENKKDLAERLEKLLKRSELIKSMGLAGYKKYRNEYTLRCFEKKVISIIRSQI